MRPAPPPRPEPWPARRSLLGGALGAVVLAVSGCGVRLEDDAPALPLIPTREPIPAEPALLWLLRDCRQLAEGDGPHTALYAEQAAVLRSALFRAGIPIGTLDEQLTPTPSTTGSPTSPTSASAPSTAVASAAPTSGSPEATATGEPTGGGADPAAALDRIADLAECGPGIFPLVMSLLGQRWSVTPPGGGSVPDGAESQGADTARLWRFRHLAAGFAEATGAAVYGFEIVAAQTREATREGAVATLTDLRRLRREQTDRAGGEVPAPVLGHPLPFPVDSEESALRLATHVLTGLTDAYGGLLLTVTGAAQRDTAHDVVAWLGAAAAQAVAWGAPLAAFPGTHDPR